MITYFQATILGLVQGFSELFPVSSLGHSVLIPQLLGWQVTQNNDTFLTFLVATHLATALVLLGFFWADWVLIAKGFVRSVNAKKIAANDTHARLAWLLIAGTIPAGILGLLLQKKLEILFGSGQAAAFFLLVNGVILYAAEWLRKKADSPKETDPDQRLAKMDWKQAFGIGVAQAIALIPGFSRSGISMVGGLLTGLTNEQAARFAFLLATPIIGAAALLKLPHLFHDHTLLKVAIVGGLWAALSAYLSVRFLLRFFKTNTLKPMALYCIIAGALASMLLTR